MELNRISELLTPFAGDLESRQLDQLATYLDVLLKWNARMNLTAVRDPEQIVTRHFGESLWLAKQMPADTADVTDIGSGAGFPGIPIGIARPGITLTLVEAQQRKATFLREVLRTIKVDAVVKNVRAEELVKSCPKSASAVTLRAVEKFQAILPVAAGLVRQATVTQGSGSLFLLIGKAQMYVVRGMLKQWQFERELPIPGSENRVILQGNPIS